MKKRKIIINILLIISLLLIILTNIFIIKCDFDIIKINYIMLIVLLIINVLLLIINNMEKGNKKNENIIILIFIIFSFCFPIYEIGILYAPTGSYSHLVGVALKQRYIDIYGIKIFENH